MGYAIIKVTKHDGISYVAWTEDEPGKMTEFFKNFVLEGTTTEVLEYVDAEKHPHYGYAGLIEKVHNHQDHYATSGHLR